MMKPTEDETRSDFVKAKRGRMLRKAQHQDALKNYKPKHNNSEYLAFIEQNADSFSINKNGDQCFGNFPKYYTLFTVISQHVQGNSVSECLDEAMMVK